MYGIIESSPARADLRIDRSEHAEWPTGMEQLPDVGQRVYCTDGMAEVVRILGKTGNGSRLLQLRLVGRTAPPFHAAASNVLVEPFPGAALAETVAARTAQTVDALPDTADRP
jgi:hypothetical protein